ncbi:PadR family transcriptional regulator [Clostridium sp.]|uniref:PadR family transcriptional regulator n=1 Tax=Clostridium sp. TaxID=1506 RepID=UPI003463BB0B
MKVSKELIKGSTSVLILSLLQRKEMYGYEMIKEIELKSSGVFSFKEGTLYPILHSLEKDTIIESYWEEGDSKRKRKYYRITREGRVYLKEKQEEWDVFKSSVDKVLLEVALCR